MAHYAHFLRGSAFALPCHTERSEVSTNLKREFVLLKRGFFTLNLSVS